VMLDTFALVKAVLPSSQLCQLLRTSTCMSRLPSLNDSSRLRSDIKSQQSLLHSLFYDYRSSQTRDNLDTKANFRALG
jgi:hypothetical protein